MRNARLIYLILFFFPLIFGYPNKSAVKPGNYSQGKHVKKYIDKISDDTNGDELPNKRKRRAKCIEVDVPNLSTLSFEQLFTYRYFKRAGILSNYSYVEYYIHGKRGPPAI